MGWEAFEQLERQQLRERRQGKLRRALGVPLPGESVEQLDRIGERDRRRAEEGLVAVLNRDGTFSHKHIDDLGRSDMMSRIAAEMEEVDWLKERVLRRNLGVDVRSLEALPTPEHLS
jgi:hypothetical protein